MSLLVSWRRKPFHFTICLSGSQHSPVVLTIFSRRPNTNIVLARLTAAAQSDRLTSSRVQRPTYSHAMVLLWECARFWNQIVCVWVSVSHTIVITHYSRIGLPVLYELMRLCVEWTFYTHSCEMQCMWQTHNNTIPSIYTPWPGMQMM